MIPGSPMGATRRPVAALESNGHLILGARALLRGDFSWRVAELFQVRRDGQVAQKWNRPRSPAMRTKAGRGRRPRATSFVLIVVVAEVQVVAEVHVFSHQFLDLGGCLFANFLQSLCLSNDSLDQIRKHIERPEPRFAVAL
jgi:hypothetical protein